MMTNYNQGASGRGVSLMLHLNSMGVPARSLNPAGTPATSAQCIGANPLPGRLRGLTPCPLLLQSALGNMLVSPLDFLYPSKSLITRTLRYDVSNELDLSEQFNDVKSEGQGL
jgi:hypothetical protein